VSGVGHFTPLPIGQQNLLEIVGKEYIKGVNIFDPSISRYENLPKIIS
jgi:hypothetical protein